MGNRDRRAWRGLWAVPDLRLFPSFCGVALGPPDSEVGTARQYDIWCLCWRVRFGDRPCLERDSNNLALAATCSTESVGFGPSSPLLGLLMNRLGSLHSPHLQQNPPPQLSQSDLSLKSFLGVKPGCRTEHFGGFLGSVWIRSISY